MAVAIEEEPSSSRVRDLRSVELSKCSGADTLGDPRGVTSLPAMEADRRWAGGTQRRRSGRTLDESPLTRSQEWTPPMKSTVPRLDGPEERQRRDGHGDLWRGLDDLNVLHDRTDPRARSSSRRLLEPGTVALFEALLGDLICRRPPLDRRRSFYARTQFRWCRRWRHRHVLHHGDDLRPVFGRHIFRVTDVVRDAFWVMPSVDRRTGGYRYREHAEHQARSDRTTHTSMMRRESVFVKPRGPPKRAEMARCPRQDPPEFQIEAGHVIFASGLNSL
jgi:hypothetical protein